MADSTSYVALDLVWDTLDATIVLGQDMPSLPCGRSRRPARPILRPASTNPVKSIIQRRRSAGSCEPFHRVQQLLGLGLRSLRVTGAHRIAYAVVDVAVQHPQPDLLERRRDGADLVEDVDAVALLLDHPLDPAHLALDPVQPLFERVLLPAVSLPQTGPSRRLRQLRSRRLLVATNRLEQAMAAAASIGFSRPANASGIRTTL